MKSYILSSVFLTLCMFALSQSAPNSSPLSSFRDSYNSKECSDCICGVVNTHRIIGGKLAGRRNFPWLVQINYKGNKWCGGSLITRRHILTAAHCFHNKLSTLFTVHLADGEHAIRLIREHQYNRTSKDNDIAIIELSMPVKLSSKVRTICLPEGDAEFDGKIGVSTGWGATFQGERNNTELRTVELPILSKSECSKTSRYPRGRLTDNMLCAGPISGEKDSCKGDSGGPLEVHQDGGSTVLAGIVSWGVGCGTYGYPGIYTKVSQYIDWIKIFTYNECLCPSMVQ